MAIFNSCGNLLVQRPDASPPTCPQGASGNHSETLADAGSRLALCCFGLSVGVHISPVAAMDADNITLQWVLFCCCDAIGDQEQMLMPGGESKREWLPLAEVINEQPLELRGAYETLHAWATPVLDERARSESVRFEPDRSDLPCLETKVAVGAERGVRLHLVSASRRGN